VGDEHDGLSGLRPDIEQFGVQAVARPGVDTPERFVHQEDLRIGGERASDTDALFHAAGQLLRVEVLETVEPHQVDQLPNPCLAVRAVTGGPVEAEPDVPADGSPGEQRVLLKDHSTV